jgi:hypothetical protein
MFQNLEKEGSVRFWLPLAALFIFIVSITVSAYSSQTVKPSLTAGRKGYYYIDGKMYIILKITKELKAYINKKNQKVYYYYKKNYYYWAKGIWFDSKKINGMFSIASQNQIPRPLKHGPILRVQRKKIPAGFAALKVPPHPVKERLPNAATEHLYNLPLTLHGLVIYQKNFNFNKTGNGD